MLKRCFDRMVVGAGIAFFWTGLCVFVSPEAAYAQDSAADKAMAETLFQDAKELLRSGRAAEACPKFEASNRLDTSVGTLAKMGECYEALGRTASAYGAYGEARRLARAKGDDVRAEVALERQRALEPKLSKLLIKAPPIEGLEVKLDGKPVSAGVFGTAVPMDPGAHEVDATAPARTSFHEDVKLEEGATKKVVVPDLATWPEVLPMEEKWIKEPPPWSVLKSAGFVTGVVGVVGLGVGIGFGAAAVTKLDESKATCPEQGDGCEQPGYSQWLRAKTYANTSTALLIAGGALAAGGAVMFVVGGQTKSKIDARRAWVVPVVTRDFGGFSAGMRF